VRQVVYRNGPPYRVKKSSATASHSAALRTSPVASQTSSIVQAAQTTVCRRRHSPASVPAIAWSMRANPSDTRPAWTIRLPRSDSADISRSTSPIRRPRSSARRISAQAASWSAETSADM
jgi:hypothetical protein